MVVVLTGLRTVLSSVVVVVELAGAAFLSVVVSFTVVQADSDTKATAARQGRMIFFIDLILIELLLCGTTLGQQWLPYHGSNPTETDPLPTKYIFRACFKTPAPAA